MKKNGIAVFASLLFSVAAMAACTTRTPSAEPDAPPEALVSGPEIARCHMGGCSWFEITDFEMIREIPDAALLRLTIREGTSQHGDNRYPSSSRGVRIDWGAPTEDYLVFCSARLPAVIRRGSQDWEAYRLDLTAPSGASEHLMAIYGHVCHNGTDLSASGAAARLGYRPANYSDPVLRLMVPEQIFQHLQ